MLASARMNSFGVEMFRYILILIIVSISSCNKIPGIDKARQMELSTNPFYDALRKGYIDFADEASNNGNKENASNYAKKAMLLADNKLPAPDFLTDKQIPSTHIHNITVARNFVIDSINQKIQHRAPLTVANLQLMFDCWVEQESNDSKLQDYPCQKGYKAEEKKIKQMMAADETKVIDQNKKTLPELVTTNTSKINTELLGTQELEPTREITSDPSMPEPYEIFFQASSAQLDVSAKRILKKAALEAIKFRPRKILINGNTDRSGTLQGNRELATKRATIVAKLLIDQGVPENVLDVRSYGASAAWVDQVPDDKDERYRSVKVIFLKDNNILNR